ncbi:UNKNOWN [Stylonychia lemnae]|uniref:Cadg domain containing protein n=1 Tax=Stylonychia lemnae TaxID=5949 RepID=A0A078ANB4_STYLE|nr:UNKNOWN [Stylonychia lemnae]|eukprot:CDW82428.1 UNKNOWN [Stylonychia lemnae]
MIILGFSILQIIICTFPLSKQFQIKRQLITDQTLRCFSPQPKQSFPQVLGGLIGDTELSCLFYNSADNSILATGSSTSTDIVDKATTPFITYIDELTGKLKWQKQYIFNTITSQVTPFTFSRCSIQQTTKNYAIVLSDNPQYGELLKALYEYSSTSLNIQKSRYAIGLMMTSSNKIYILNGELDKVMVSAFQFDVSLNQISPIYYKAYGTSSNKFYGYEIGLTSALDYVYVVGRIKTLLAMSKIQLSNGVASYSYMIDNSQGSSALKALTKIEIYEYLGQIFQITCAENLGPNGNDVGILDFSESFGTGLALAKSWYFSMTAKTRCLAVQFNSYTVWYLMHIENSGVYFSQTDVSMIGSSTTWTLMRLASSSSQTLFAKDGYIKTDGTKIYWLGSTQAINSKSYNKKVGFLMNYPYSQCIPSTTSVTQSVSIQNIFIFQLGLTAYFSNPSQSTYTATNENILFKQIDGITSKSMLITDLVNLPDECQQLMSQGIISPPILSSLVYNYQISLNSSILDIYIPDFQYSLACQDLSWKYSISLQNLQNSPLFITFQQIYAGGSQLSVTSANNLTAGVYQLLIKALLNNQYSSTLSLTLNMLAIPYVPQNDSADLNQTNQTSSSNNQTNNTSTNQTNSTNSNNQSDPVIPTNSTNLTNETTNQTNSSNETSQNTTLPTNSTQNNQTIENQGNQTESNNQTNSTLNETQNGGNETIPNNQTQIDNNTTKNQTDTNQTQQNATTNYTEGNGDQNITNNTSNINQTINNTVNNQSQTNQSTTNPDLNQTNNNTQTNITQETNQTDVRNQTNHTDSGGNSTINSTTENNQTDPISGNGGNNSSKNDSGNSTTNPLQNSNQTDILNETFNQNQTINQTNQQNQSTTNQTQSTNQTYNNNNTDQTYNNNNTNETTTNQSQSTNQTQNNNNTNETSNNNTLNQTQNSSEPNPGQNTMNQTLQQNSAPFFQSQIQQDIQMYVNENYQYRLPSYFDPEGDNITITYLILFKQSIPEFIDIQSKSIKLNPDLNDYGTYNLVITLKDNNTIQPMESKYMIKIIVKPLEKKRNEEEYFESLNETNQQGNGQIKENYNVDKDFKIIVDKINQRQELKIKFSQPLLVELSEQQIREFLMLQVLGADGKSKLRGWDIISSNQNGISLELKFTNNHDISSGEEADIIQLSINNAKHAISSKSQLYMDKSLIISTQVPTQFDNDGKLLQLIKFLDELRISEYSDSLISTLLTSVIFGSLAMSATVGTSLQMLWGLINNLQLVTHTPLFKIPYSANILNFLRALFSVVNFDVIGTEMILEKVFDLQSSDDYTPYNDNFTFLGYDNSNFIYLIGFPILILIMNILLTIFYLLISRIKLKLFFIEISLEASFSAVITFSDLSIKEKGDYFALGLTIISMGLNLCFVFLLPWLLYKHRKNPVHQQNSKYLAEILDDSNPNNVMMIFYHSIFVMRRFIFVAITFGLKNNLNAQICIFRLCNVLYIAYLLHQKDNEDTEERDEEPSSRPLNFPYFTNRDQLDMSQTIRPLIERDHEIQQVNKNINKDSYYSSKHVGETFQIQLEQLDNNEQLQSIESVSNTGSDEGKYHSKNSNKTGSGSGSGSATSSQIKGKNMKFNLKSLAQFQSQELPQNIQQENFLRKIKPKNSSNDFKDIHIPGYPIGDESSLNQLVLSKTNSKKQSSENINKNIFYPPLSNTSSMSITPYLSKNQQFSYKSGDENNHEELKINILSGESHRDKQENFDKYLRTQIDEDQSNKGYLNFVKQDSSIRSNYRKKISPKKVKQEQSN